MAKRTIKSGKNIGVAVQVQGQTVDVIPHPRLKGLWQFEFEGEKWMASDYAFVEEEQSENAVPVPFLTPENKPYKKNYIQNAHFFINYNYL